MAEKLKVYTRDCAGLDPGVVKEILADLVSQPDIVAAEECGAYCLQLNFKGGRYQIKNLPPEIAGRIPAVVNKVRQMSQVPY